jgi:hypothetical protein
MAAIEEIEIDDFPFGQAARALVRAVAGEWSGALDDAAAVEAIRGASYFDIALARLAGVLAANRTGDLAASRRWLDQLGTLASSVGDVVFVGVAQVLGDQADVRTEPDQQPVLAPGWRTVLDSAVVG